MGCANGKMGGAVSEPSRLDNMEYSKPISDPVIEDTAPTAKAEATPVLVSYLLAKDLKEAEVVKEVKEEKEEVKVCYFFDHLETKLVQFRLCSGLCQGDMARPQYHPSREIPSHLRSWRQE